MTTTFAPTSARHDLASPRTAELPADLPTDLSTELPVDLMPWRAFEPAPGAVDAVAGARARRAADRRAHRIAQRLAGLTGADLLPADRADAVRDVALHLQEWAGPVAVEGPGPGSDGRPAGDGGPAGDGRAARDAELQRVLGGYDHHLGHHRYVLDGQVTAADFLLWAVVITLPVRLGEERAADALRGLDHLRAWARRLGRAHPGPVEAVAADALAEVTGRGHRRPGRPALGNVA